MDFAFGALRSEYTLQRSKLSKNLRELGIKDPNDFNSLWDWYGYGFGEQTVDMLCDRVYPDYFDASITVGENWPDEEEATTEDVTAAIRSLNDALIKERTRQWGEIKEPEISDDPEAARLQKAGFDLPKTMAEPTAKEHRHRQFLNATPKTDKVQ
jgi:hypothetical protein